MQANPEKIKEHTEYLRGMLRRLFRYEAYTACTRADKVQELTGRRGYTFLGEGHFSTVVSHWECPGVVFKLCTREHDAYLSYALWVREVKARAVSEPWHKHLPEVYSLNVVHGGYVAVLECLEPVDIWDSDTTGIPDGRGGQVYPLDMCHAQCGIGYLNRFKGDVVYADLLDTTRPEYVAGQKILEYFRGAARIDLHSENMMCRQDGTLVITDPVSFTSAY